MQIKKIASYVGFAVKSNQIIFGLDNLKKNYKAAKLVIADKNIGLGATRELTFLKENKNVEVISIDNVLVKDLVFRDGCKIIAVTSEQLAAAIKENVFSSEVKE